MRAIEYGIVCDASDEKFLVKNINSFLDRLSYRKMYKRTPSGLRDPEQPKSEPRYDHYYCQFHKQHPSWYFDLYPNADLDGKLRFPDRPDVSWTLFVNKTNPEQDSDEEDASLDRFFSALRDGAGFQMVLIHTYRQGENRL